MAHHRRAGNRDQPVAFVEEVSHFCWAALKLAVPPFACLSKLARVKELGAHAVFNYAREPNWTVAALAPTDAAIMGPQTQPSPFRVSSRFCSSSALPEHS